MKIIFSEFRILTINQLNFDILKKKFRFKHQVLFNQLFSMGRFFVTYFSFLLFLFLSVSEVKGQLNATFTSTDQNQCPGNLFTLSASNPTYSNYAWTITGPSGFNSSLTGSSIVVFLNNSGLYNVTLTVTDAGVSTTNIQSGFLEVYSPPTINYNLSTASGCSPLNVNFNGSSTPGSGTFQSFAISSANGTISNTEDFSVIYNSAGVYNPTATVTNSFGCFTTMNLPAITVLQAPSLTSPLNSNSVCSGTLFNYGFLSSMPGTTYSWTRAQVVGISPNSGNGNGDISEVLINNTLNSIVVPYIVTLTAPNGCVSVQTINVTVRALPTVSANTTNINICEGQTTNLNAIGSVPNGQFSWSTGEETNAITVATAGIYSVTFNNGICTSLPLNINVNTIVAPSVNLSNTENSGIASNDASICAGSAVQLTASPAVAGGTYLWMPGNLTAQSISVSPLSTTVYTLVYTLGCPSIPDSITVVVNNLPINTFTASTSNACSAPVTTAFTSTTLNANGALTTWSFPGASSPSTGIGAGPIAVTYNSSGNYSISMTSTSLDGCSSTSVFPSAITVGNGAPPTSSFVNLTSVTQCVNADNYCFQYTGSGADTILLDFGNGFSAFFDPTISYCYSYPVLGNYTVSMTPFTTVGNALGCSGSTSQVNVIVTGPQSNFSASQVDCDNQLVRSFSSTSTGTSPSTVYTWNFGDGSPNSNLLSVSHTFPTYGTYVVNLTVSDIATGCLPTQRNFTVNANPNNLADFQSNDAGVLSSDVCIGGTLQFVNTTPAPQYNSGVAPASTSSVNTLWDWNTNSGISFVNTSAGLRGTPRSRTFNSPTYAPGNYGVGMINIDNNGCNDTVIHIIHIHGVTGTFVTPDTICNGLSFSATDNSIAPNGSIVSRVWDWGDGTPNTLGNFANPTHTYSSSGNYTITLTVADDFGCTKTSTRNVVVRKPFASFSVDQDFICNNQTVSVSPNSFGVGTLTYEWNATNASPISANGANPGVFTFNQQGNQTISLSVSDNLGCIDDTIIPITVLDVSASALASANSFACFNPPNVVSFTNTSSNNPDNNSAQWDFGNGQTSTNWNPSTVYSLPGTYNVTLIVSSMPTSSGAVCRDTQQVVIVNIGGPNGTLDVTNSNLTGCSCYLASIDVNTTGATEAKLLFGNGAFVDLVPNTAQTVTYSYCNTGTTQIQFVPSLFLSNGACFGYIPSLDTIRIQPTPTVNAITNQVFCANSTTNTVNFSSPVVNTTFSWTNSNATIGLAASGSGSILPFVGLNNTSNQQNATISVTPNANGCPGNPVSFTYSINALATISAGIDQTICGNSTVALAGTQGGSTTSATWSGGTGTFSPNATTLNAVYTPSAAEISAGSVTLTLTSNDPTGPCPSVSDQVVITINQPATVDVGIDQTICGSTPVTLAGTQGGSATSSTWSGGTGTFSPNATTLNATYTPSAADVTAGSVTLTITTNNPAGPCPAATDQLLITIAQPATISAGIDQTICGNSTVALAGTQGGSTTAATWSGGTGTFSPNATTLNAVYTPSAAEISAGNVTLTLTSNDPNGPCPSVSDQVFITINQPATVDAGIDQIICGSTPVTLAGTQGGAATSSTWSGGTGIFSPNATTLNATYTPSAADVTAGSVTLTITTNNPAGPCPAATDQVLITIAQPATISAGIDQTICGNSTVALAGTQGGSTTSATWSGGTGTFSPNATTLNAVYAPSAAEINAGIVTLTLTSNDPTGPCPSVSDQVVITINQPATINAGVDQTICGTSTAVLSGTPGGSATSATWSGGAGTFSPNATNLNAIYTPSTAEISAGSVTLTLTSNDPNGPCPSVLDQVLITINQPATISAGIDQTICGNSTVTLAGTQGGSTTSATWSGGTGTFSPNATTLNAVYAPSAAEISAGNVTLTLTSNDPIGPCPSVSDQVVITINQPATINAGVDQTICGTSIAVLSGTLGGSATSATWSGGTGNFSPNATNLNAIYTPSAAEISAGSVILTLTSNDPVGPCGAVSDQVLITINQAAIINAGIDQAICGTTTVLLAGTQGGSTSSATWSGGTGIFSPNATTLNAVYTPSAAEINAGSVLLTLTSNDPVGPCGAVSDQVLITINQSATVNAGIDQTICGAIPVSLAGIQGGATSSITWSGGTGTFSPNATTLNTVYTPSAADLAAGSVTLTITSNDPVGPCISVSDQVVITVNSLPTIISQDTVVLCSGESLNYPIVSDVVSDISWLGVDNQNVNGETITVQNGNFIGDNLDNATNNIEYVTYNIDLTSVFNGCQSVNQNLIVQVNPLPIIDSIGDLFYCDGVITAPIIFGSSLSNSSYLWTNSNPAIGLSANGVGNIPAFTPSNNSPSDISATITVIPENAGCQGNSFDFTITIGPVPNVSISPAGPYCVSSPSDFLVADVGNGFWSGPGIVNSVTGEFDPSFANIGVNIITYTLNGVCGGGSSIDILVYPNPEASFTADNFSTSVLDPVFYFENTSVNATTYTWNFGNGTSSTLENPTQIYPEVIGYYLVELIATNNSGCVDTATNFVYVEEETIFYVPNAFSPDGNEVNNIFYPVFSEGYDPDYYSLRIFNRWGEVVFETTKVTEGWDGTYKGEMCQDGTYVWSISFKAATSDLVYRHEGHVVLIK
jgi:gliding motility-associated-like protein